jgi:predicted aspartyl protease
MKVETTAMDSRTLFRAFLSLGVLLSLAAIPGSAESRQTVTVSMRPYKGGRSVVAVKLNGAGPYDFMVDTGATVTVVDTALFAELGLHAEGKTRIVSSAGTTNQFVSKIKEITLDDLSVENITVVSMQSPMKDFNYRGVRGILGENFLRHFDILLDNQHRTVTLDTADGLAVSLIGEHLPILFPPLPHEDESLLQPMISANLRGYGRVKLLLDSGAAELVLLQLVGLSGLGDTRVTTVNGSMICESTNTILHLGKGEVREIPMMSCQGQTVKSKGSDGTLPTAIFKQIFISHAGSYAIINPTPVRREIAVIAKLSQ